MFHTIIDLCGSGMHPTRHLILNTQTWEDKYEICNHVCPSAGRQGLITNQSPAHVHNVCMIQKQAEHSVYVYTLKTSSAGEVLKVCGFSPNSQYVGYKHKVLVQQWRNSREANINRIAARIWFLHFFVEAWCCVTMTTANGIWSLAILADPRELHCG